MKNAHALEFETCAPGETFFVPNGKLHQVNNFAQYHKRKRAERGDNVVFNLRTRTVLKGDSVGVRVWVNKPASAEN